MQLRVTLHLDSPPQKFVVSFLTLSLPRAFVFFKIFLGVFLDKLSVYPFCLLESEWLSLQLSKCIIWLLFCLVLFLTQKQTEEQFSILKTVEKCCINPSPVLHTCTLRKIWLANSTIKFMYKTWCDALNNLMLWIMVKLI